MADTAETPSTLGTLAGLWRRKSLAGGGRAPFEDSDALWIQLGAFFVDLRTPLGAGALSPPAAFSGRAQWRAPRITFCRDLDLERQKASDEAELRLNGDTLIERGIYRAGDQPLPSAEVWLRERRGPAKGRVLEGRAAPQSRASGRLIELGATAIAIIDAGPAGFSAVEFCRTKDEWRPTRRLGRPPPDLPRGDGLRDGTNWAGLYWAVVDHAA